MTDVQINPLLNLGPCPSSLDEVKQIKGYARTIMTLMRAEEDTRRLYNKFIQPTGIKWRWQPLIAHSTIIGPIESFLNAAVELDKELKQGPVYLHCREGVHRTGIVAYLYYRRQKGYEPDQAREAVFAHRAEIRNRVGKKVNNIFTIVEDMLEGKRVS